MEPARARTVVRHEVPAPVAAPAARRNPFEAALVALVAVIAAGLVLGPMAAAAEPALRDVRSEPFQGSVPDPTPWSLGRYTVTPLATYDLTAVVLSSRSYAGDRESEASPLDLALGWGPMADREVLSSYDISQRDRWYYVRWTQSPLARDEIIRSSANTHVLPADGHVAQQLAAVEPGEVVRLRGYLVEVTAEDGWRWRSSLTRDDTGQGACEVFWVEAVEVAPRASLP